jgi:hypothetical protein
MWALRLSRSEDVLLRDIFGTLSFSPVRQKLHLADRPDSPGRLFEKKARKKS